MATKPTICFVPGAWHKPEGFTAVMEPLKAAGHPIVSIALPSVGANPAKSGMEPDTEAIRAAVEPLVEEGKEVVIVVHSYGSLPTCNAMRGLGREERRKAGKDGGVVRLVYIAAFVIDEGGSVLAALGGKDLPWFNTNLETGIVTPDGPRQVFYGDLPDEEAQKWIDRLETFSYGCFISKVEYAAYKDIASTYLFCTEDMALPLPVQEAMVGSSPGSFAVERIKASHSPFLSKPEETVEVIKRAASGAELKPVELTT